MRDNQEPQTDRTKRSRRQWLVALVLAGSPCLAQEPQTGGIGVLPPLPLNPSTAVPTVRTNPFYVPEKEPQKAVLLTTGASQSTPTIHLSPIGAAIGLNPIGMEQTTARPAARGPIMTIEPAHESTVQINPLLKSVHRPNNELVDAHLAPAKPVSHSTPEIKAKANRPERNTGEASILLVTPAPKPLLVVKPQTAKIPVPPRQAQPLTAVKPLPQAPAAAKLPVANAKQPSVTPKEKAFQPAKPQPVVSSTANAPTTGDKQSSKTASVTSTGRKKSSGTSGGGASIASMLNQNPSTTAEAAEKDKPAPIFFSLSDSTEVAPSNKVVAPNRTIKLPNLSSIKDQAEESPLPLTVTLKEDGSIVTKERPKRPQTESQASQIPQPILAESSKLGTELGLPAPKALPKTVSESKQIPKSSDTVKQNNASGKSVLSTDGPSSSNDHEKLSVAAVKNFKPRDSSSGLKTITPAKPFSIMGEMAKPMAEDKPMPEAPSVIAQAPSNAKSPRNSKPDNGKLTLPTPINIAADQSSSPLDDKAGRSVIKVEKPSPKDSAQNNPHAQLAKSDSKPELVNPFNRKKTDRTATESKQELPTAGNLNQAVRVEKFQLSKDRPRVRVNLESVIEAEKKAKESPIASGVVAPISLPESVKQRQATAAVAKAESDTEATKATPSVTPPKMVPDSILADSANSEKETSSSVAKNPTVNAGEPSGTTILRKRYRPPVAVQAIPGTISRQSPMQSTDQPKVQAVSEVVIGNKKTQPPTVDLQQAMRLDTASELKDRSLILGPEVKLTPLHMNQAQVRSLTLGGSVRGVRVGDKGVCQAFASGPNQLKLIGTGIGTTRLIVWAQKDGQSEEVLMRAFEIHVNEVVPNEGNSIENTTLLLNQSIQKVFPQSRAKVQLVRGELWVTGTCESQDSAEKIIRMVRKSCLIPVRDQLTIK
jgi:hypothetical protein